MSRRTPPCAACIDRSLPTLVKTRQVAPARPPCGQRLACKGIFRATEATSNQPLEPSCAHRLPTQLALCTEQGAHAFAPPGYVKPSARCERCVFCSFPRRFACCGWKSVNRARGAFEDRKPAWKGCMSLLSLWGKLPWSSVAIWSILKERKFCTHIAVLHKKYPGNSVLTYLISMPTDLTMWFLSWARTQPQPWLVPLGYSMGSQK